MPRINNALIGIDLFGDLKKKNASDAKIIKQELSMFFKTYSHSFDANEHLFNPLEQTLSQLGQRILGGTGAVNSILQHAVSNSTRSILTKNKKDFQRVVPSIQDVFEDRPREQAILNQHIKENVRLIKNVDNRMVDDITTIVNNGIQRGDKQSDIIKSLQPILKRTNNGYKLIARDQGNKLYASITEARAKVNNWQFYEWSTSKDVRVRDFSNSNGYSDHARLDGKIFRFDDPPRTVFKGKRSGERNNPGQDIRCRCVAIILFEPPSAFKKSSGGSYRLLKDEK